MGQGAAYVLARPRLWKWLIAPAIVTLVIFGGAAVAVWASVDSLVGRISDAVPSWLAGLAGVGVTVVVIAGLLAGGLAVFATVAGMIAGPFNEFLSEAIEEELTGVRAPSSGVWGFVTSALRGIAHGLRRLVIFLIGALLLLLLAFIPVIGTIAAVAIGFWIAARAAAYDSYDAVLARRNLPYGAKAEYLAEHRGRTVGLGAAVAALLLVPGVNLVALGLGAAGATLAAHQIAGAPRARQHGRLR